MSCTFPWMLIFLIAILCAVLYGKDARLQDLQEELRTRDQQIEDIREKLHYWQDLYFGDKPRKPGDSV